MIDREQKQLEDVKITLKKMVNLNSVFYDSVRYNQCEGLDKYLYVSLTMGQYIWKLAQDLNVEL
ncbi:hypothetical protein J6E39_04355 [bacterium]|nr:hypothetical protein [bacterium]